MNFFDDCDKILKIYYDHFFKGKTDENGKLVWKELPKFERVCEQNISIKEYGYIQAIQHQLNSDAHLISIVGSIDSVEKKYLITPKGFAFVVNGGYRKQVKDEKEKIKLNRINSFGSTLGWIVAAIFGGLQFYQSTKINDDITTLKKEISQVQSKMVADSMQNHKRSLQQQNPKQIPLGKTHD